MIWNRNEDMRIGRLEGDNWKYIQKEDWQNEL